MTDEFLDHTGSPNHTARIPLAAPVITATLFSSLRIYDAPARMILARIRAPGTFALVSQS
jgi:hypothetical protein